MSALKRFLKDTIIYGIAAVLPRAINIILVKLHTSKLSAEKYAVNTDYYVYAAYFNALLTYGMETAFFRFFSKEKDKGKVVSTSFLSLATTTFLFLVAMLIFSNQIAAFFGFKNLLFFKLLIWTTVLDTMVVIPYAYLRVSNRPIRFTLYKVLNILIFAFFNVFFLWFVPYAIRQNISLPNSIVSLYQNNPKVIFIFIAGTIASASTFILLLPTFFKFKIQFDFELLKRMLRYSVPILIAGLAYVTNENLDKLLLGDMVGEQQMGVYAACYKLGVFMTLFIMAFRLGAEPFFFNHSEEKNAKKHYAIILNWFIITGAFFMIFIIAFIDIFASILLGSDEYFEALMIVPIILFANLLLGIYHNLAIWYKLTDKTRFAMYFSITGAFITIVFNLVMIPKIGFMASAWATLLAYGVMMLLSYFIGRKHYPVPYNIKKSLGYLGAAVVFSFLSFIYFRENYVVSIGLVIIFGLIIIWNEKKELLLILKRK